MGIEHISYPSSAIDVRFERYWKSLPIEVRENLNKDSVEETYVNGFEDAITYLCNAKKVKLKIDIDDR